MGERLQKLNIGDIIELRTALSEEFGEEALRDDAEEFQDLISNPQGESLNEEDQALIDLFLLAMRISAPPENGQETRKN